MRLGYLQASLLTKKMDLKLKNAVKGGNLTICFQGFIPKGYKGKLDACAEIGALAATFDLLSDGLNFDQDAYKHFNTYCEETLRPDSYKFLTNLLIAKRENTLRQHGLERGVYAIEIILRHLDVRSEWDKNLDVEKFGIRSQIADDLLDYEKDAKSNHLNFIKTRSAKDIIQDYIDWDYEKDIQISAYPFILSIVLRKSKEKAYQILRSRITSSTIHKVKTSIVR